MEIRSGTESLLLHLLRGTGKRSQVIASNIANQNTPGYRRQTVEFEDLLTRALDDGNGELLAIQPKIGEDFESPTRVDGNNVNLELEVYASRENRVLAETYRAMLSGHYRLLDAALGHSG